ncbi:MAG: P-II family nitrogen regulator [Pseudomonadota bacterium]
MKMIVAIIRPSAMEGLRDALAEAGVDGMTAFEAKGYGRQKGHTEIYRGAEYKIDFVPKVRVEIVVSAEQAPDVIDIVAKATRTGKIGDGKIFVLPVEEAMRVRTGEKGADAL